MEKQKASVDAHIDASNIERGVAILLTGNGKGKSFSAFGMVMRALGYGQNVGIIQFFLDSAVGRLALVKNDLTSITYRVLAFHPMGERAIHSRVRPWCPLAALEKLPVGPAMTRFPNTTRKHP